CGVFCWSTKMLGPDDQGFVDINATALNAAINGSILADPDACLVMMMALPFGSTRALARAHEISHRPLCSSDRSACHLPFSPRCLSFEQSQFVPLVEPRRWTSNWSDRENLLRSGPHCFSVRV